MNEKSRVEFVRSKYRLTESVTIQMEENGKPLGVGPLMSEETFQRFIDSDPSGNHKYLDWMLFQAGGGHEPMEKSMSLWAGEGANDPHSLRNQYHEDFVSEHTKGFSDETGHHAPVSREEAEKMWAAIEETFKLEFLYGDQDIAFEEGYGYYRSWPGKDSIYIKVVNAVKLWHMGLPKLKAQNERFSRAQLLKDKPKDKWTVDDYRFNEKFAESPVSGLIELDIYAGWQPKSYSQPEAKYKSLEDLLNAVADLRKQRVLNDVRHEVVYSDHICEAICPLTIGASLKFGNIKWCTANRTDFDRSFDGRTEVSHNWKNYTSKGPLIYVRFKIPMPDWLSMLALQLTRGHLNKLGPPWSSNVGFIDLQNVSGGTDYAKIIKVIHTEHEKSAKGAMSHEGMPSDEVSYKYGGRTTARAWDTKKFGEEVRVSFDSMMKAVGQWGKNFNCDKIITDHLAEAGANLDLA
jgi:hypothetical protein